MRVRHVMATAALAVGFAACASSGAGEPLEPVYATVCEARCACEDCSGDNDGLCEAEQDALTDRAEERCQDEHTEYIECVRLEGRCVDGHHVAEVCDEAEAALLGCLDLGDEEHCSTAGDGICDEPEGTGACPAGTDPDDCRSLCPSTGNGVCDEPENTGLCPAGTDVEDCALPRCEYVMDGTCDEPEGTNRCPEGTDVDDCAAPTCADTNDSECDEPEGTGTCAEGTDVDDCAVEPCLTTNDGECDEPEGTGTCAEGTDVNDCNDLGTCDNLRSCGNETSGCVACANEGSCADALEACVSNDECVYFRQCAVTCAKGDAACLSVCESQRPAGASMYRLYDRCVHCSECRISCNKRGLFGC
ncbi:latent transforming growth factor beta-binding protein [Sorangium sp. So ce176]|uniref:latent transforming growth factor beta-binding protein n=1 Tax=Sorangium sp. So ce176 TaxID=3133286 RepID=UPI003F5D942C